MTENNIRHGSGCECGALYGIDCDVTSCKFHGTDNSCHADSIAVESHNAMRAAETFCATFAPRTN